MDGARAEFDRFLNAKYLPAGEAFFRTRSSDPALFGASVHRFPLYHSNPEGVVLRTAKSWNSYSKAVRHFTVERGFDRYKVLSNRLDLYNRNFGIFHLHCASLDGLGKELFREHVAYVVQRFPEGLRVSVIARSFRDVAGEMDEGKRRFEGFYGGSTGRAPGATDPDNPPNANTVEAYAEYEKFMAGSYVEGMALYFRDPSQPSSLIAACHAFPTALSAPDGTQTYALVEDWAQTLAAPRRWLQRKGFVGYRRHDWRLDIYNRNFAVYSTAADAVDGAGATIMREAATYTLQRLPQGIRVTAVGRVYPKEGVVTLEDAWAGQDPFMRPAL
ncbi:hypothetical protein DFJ74DRAFT_667890 [Hyaloraphidium curvatum]|nr:hypothetical protein DFJ74DRAFT_667890 [Hyaloraphidium curvatum]